MKYQIELDGNRIPKIELNKPNPLEMTVNLNENF